MTVENEHRADNKTLREFYEATGSKGVLWIDDRTGRIVDELEVETRIRSGEGGCQLCHEELDGREAHGEVDFDERGLPRVLFGPGGPICADCVEWVRWLRHYAGREPLSTPRFQEGLVLRAGTEEIYRILEATLFGLPAAGIWFPVYRCKRIEVRGSSGEILSACLGLEFELADFELQPVPPRYAIGIPGNQPIDSAAEVIDLVGAPPRLPTIEYAPVNCSGSTSRRSGTPSTRTCGWVLCRSRWSQPQGRRTPEPSTHSERQGRLRARSERGSTSTAPTACRESWTSGSGTFTTASNSPTR